MENEIFLGKTWNFNFRENIMEKSRKIRKHHAKSLILMCHGKNYFMSILIATHKNDCKTFKHK